LNTNVNLAAMSAEERAAIELDKQRWKEAHYMLSTKRPEEIRAFLAREMDEEYREDLRRRLNTIRRNRLEAESKAENKRPESSQKRRAG
jgi:outer membrane lipopolysaccharide assembly protein LptE/RlpB